MLLGATVVVGLFLSGVRCQYLSYNPDTYPDSEREWTLCRTPGKSLACDPNQLLNSVDGLEGVLKLSEALERVRQSTNCSCTNEDFPLGHCDFKPQGYTISIAVLYRIEGTPETDDVDPAFSEQLASVFANALRQRFRRGQCQDDVFIVLSLNNSAVWSSVGNVAGRRLAPSILKTVSTNAKRYFRKHAYTEGLLYMVQQYEKMLAGGTPEDLDLYSDEGIWSILPLWAWISIGAVILVGIVFAVALCVMMLALGDFSMRRSPETLRTSVTNMDWTSEAFRSYVVSRLEAELMRYRRLQTKTWNVDDAREIEAYVYSNSRCKDDYMRTVTKIVNAIAHSLNYTSAQNAQLPMSPAVDIHNVRQ